MSTNTNKWQEFTTLVNDYTNIISEDSESSDKVFYNNFNSVISLGLDIMKDNWYEANVGRYDVKPRKDKIATTKFPEFRSGIIHILNGYNKYVKDILERKDIFENSISECIYCLEVIMKHVYLYYNFLHGITN